MSKRYKLYVLCFLIALLFRVLLIFLSHSKDHEIDLAIYRDAGQLVVNGINPYNFSDNVDLRSKLRTDNDNYNEYVSSEQERWDYYANSNLPLATLFFGSIEYFFASTRSFRYIFAFFDSILSVLILAFVLNKWEYELPYNKLTVRFPARFRKNFTLFVGFSLGCVSPILLEWGTLISEPKGIGLLLILSAIYFADNSSKRISMILSPVLLGCSVAFIGVGVFISPICIYIIYKNNSYGFRNALIYCSISLFTFALWFVPFLPDILTMMLNRINGAVVMEPYHGSMWAEMFILFPEKWLLIKNGFIVLFIIVSITGFLKKRLDVSVLFANLLFLFTCILLLDGSLDRMNIAIVTLIILLGLSHLFYISNILLIIYLIYGVFSLLHTYIYGLRQDFDGGFVFIFTIVYFILLLVQIFKNKPIQYEAFSSYPRLQ